MPAPSDRDQRSCGLDRAHDVLDALARRGAGAQLCAEPQLGPAEQRHQHDRAHRQCDGEHGGVRVAAEDEFADCLEDEVRRSRKKLAATHLCARASLVGDSVRRPVKRQTTMSEASASTKELAAHVTTPRLCAWRPARTPTKPSTLIHARLTQASSLAWRAARSHAALGRAAAAPAAGPCRTTGSSKRAHAGVALPARTASRSARPFSVRR